MLALSPAVTVFVAGLVVTLAASGFALTVNVAAVLVAVLDEFVKTARYSTAAQSGRPVAPPSAFRSCSQRRSCRFQTSHRRWWRPATARLARDTPRPPR